MTSVDLKLDRPQLPHLLLFLEYNKSQKTQMLLQAYLYLLAMTVFIIQLATLTVYLILSDAGSSLSSCRIWIIQAPALVDWRRRSYNN